MQRALVYRFVASVVGVCGAVLVLGCGKPPAATPTVVPPTAEQLPRERSKLFAQITAKPFAAEMKAYFTKRIPHRSFKVSVLGPMSASRDGKVVRHQVEVQLFAEDASDKNAKDEPLIMEDLKVYLGGLVAENGSEIKGPVYDTADKGKKIGFWFEYKSASHSGALRADREKAVLGGILVVVSENE